LVLDNEKTTWDLSINILDTSRPMPEDPPVTKIFILTI
jgi:hypothetical protein